MIRVVSQVVLAFLCFIQVGLAELAPAATVAEHLQGLSRVMGQFKQTTRMGQDTQSTQGQLAIERPGKLYWHIHHPYEQILTLNGTRSWQYEPDLNQVIIKDIQLSKIGVSLLLLGGDVKEVLALFTVEQINEGVFTLTPLEEDEGLTTVTLSFKGSTLQEIAYTNPLGQHITIALSALNLSPQIPPNLFQFTPPEGVDIVELKETP